MKKNFYFLNVSVLFILFCIFMPSDALAQAGKNDPTFNTFDISNDETKGANGVVLTSLVLPDGRIMIGGGFSSYNGEDSPGIARLNVDGSFDRSFRSRLTPGDIVNSIVLMADNKFTVSGDFQHSIGKPASRIARLLDNGRLDRTYRASDETNGSVDHIVLQPNGKLLIQGSFTKYGKINSNKIARLNNDGALDPTFNYTDTTPQSPSNIALQKDGKILIILRSYGTFDKLVIRLDPNGNPDVFFNAPKKGTASISLTSVAVQLDDKIIVGGTTQVGIGAPDSYSKRFNADGTLDEVFQPSVTSRIADICIQKDGKIIFVGMNKNVNVYKPYAINTIERFNTDGTRDSKFNEKISYKGVGFENRSISVQRDGKIILGGHFQRGQSNLTRLKPDGSIDIGFNKVTGANGTIKNMALQLNRKILISGNFSSFNYTSANTLARLNSNGSLDTQFSSGSGVGGDINCMTVLSDKNIMIAGHFTDYNGTKCGNVVRLSETGDIDPTFKSETDPFATVISMNIQPDHKIIISGSFAFYNGTFVNGIARLNKNGTIDPTFVLDGKIPSNSIVSKLLDDGKIIIGASNKVFRLNPSGSIDSSFITNTAFENIDVITLQDDGKILVGGNNSVFQNRGFVVRLLPTGELDTTFTNKRNLGRVTCITVLKNNKVIVGKEESVSRLNPDGTVDLTAEADGPGANAQVWCAVEIDNGKVLIGGDFTAYGGTQRNGIARIKAEGSPSPYAREADINVLDDVSAISIIAYPNPVKTNLTIANLNAGISLIILNALGEIIDERYVEDTQLTIETSDYKNGIYFIRALDNGKISNTKFIVNK